MNFTLDLSVNPYYDFLRENHSITKATLSGYTYLRVPSNIDTIANHNLYLSDNINRALDRLKDQEKEKFANFASKTQNVKLKFVESE